MASAKEQMEERGFMWDPASGHGDGYFMLEQPYVEVNAEQIKASIMVEGVRQYDRRPPTLSEPVRVSHLVCLPGDGNWQTMSELIFSTLREFIASYDAGTANPH